MSIIDRITGRASTSASPAQAAPPPAPSVTIADLPTLDGLEPLHCDPALQQQYDAVKARRKLSASTRAAEAAARHQALVEAERRHVERQAAHLAGTATAEEVAAAAAEVAAARERVATPSDSAPVFELAEHQLRERILKDRAARNAVRLGEAQRRYVQAYRLELALRRALRVVEERSRAFETAIDNLLFPLDPSNMSQRGSAICAAIRAEVEAETMTPTPEAA